MRPLFKGHYQPKVPADLGYYDLRLPIIREQQAELAKEAGIEGFCYYHYWFGKGKQELELPFNEVLSSGSPNYPFCLCWANESWYSKFWNPDGSSDKKLLVEQLYLGEDDQKQHFYSVLPAFKDKRYILIDEKPLFMVYKPNDIPDLQEFISRWQLLAQTNGLKGITFVAYSLNAESEYDYLKQVGFDYICSCHLSGSPYKSRIKRYIDFHLRRILGIPRIYQYKKESQKLITDFEYRNDVFPTIIPNWDHTPRSGKNGYLFHGSTPYLFERHVLDALEHIKTKPTNQQICFLKSWNEWGEGNYMEPDLRFGKGYIMALQRALNCYICNHS